MAVTRRFTGRVNNVLIYYVTAEHIEDMRLQHVKSMEKLYEKETNTVLEHLNSVDGFTRMAYLSRVSMPTTYATARHLATTAIIEKVMNILMEESSEFNEQRVKKEADVHEKLAGLRTLCQLANTPNRLQDFVKWLKDDAPKFNEALASCLTIYPQELTQEACFAIGYLARKLHFWILKGFEVIIVALLRVLALCMVPKEIYIESLHEARRLHDEQQIYRKRKQAFHQQPVRYEYSAVFHRLVGIVYFTLADLLYSIPHPEIIHFFETRIIRRREMTRILLFQILDTVTSNLADIRDEARRLSGLPETDDEATAPSPPIRETYDEDLWNKLPLLLYTDLLPAYNDSNVFNRELIAAILNMLRFHAPVKDSTMDNKTLKTLENYFALENAEKVQAEKNKKLSINLPLTGGQSAKLPDIKRKPARQNSKGSRGSTSQTSTTTPSPEANMIRPTVLAENFNDLLQQASTSQPGSHQSHPVAQVLGVKPISNSVIFNK